MQRRFGMAAAVCLAILCGAGAPRSGAATVVAARVAGPIFAPTTAYVERALRRAERTGAACLLLELDTPGGSGDAMRRIAQLFLNTATPVVVYVAPAGAQAASAGAIIGLAAHVLAMAPGTNIGAAHPVTGGGQDLPGDLRGKVTADAAAFARALAGKRGRSTRWAEAVVVFSQSASETEALREHVSDLIAVDRADLLRQVDGRAVITAGGTRMLRTRAAAMQEERPTWLDAFLLFLCNPNVTIVLFALAVYGLIGELSNPGTILPGVTGAIALVLGLYSMSALTVNAAGVALLVVAVLLFAIDVYAPSHGVLTIGGVAAFVAGAMLLFADPLTAAHLSRPMVAGIALTNALFFGTIVAAAWRSHHAAPVVGPEALMGAEGQARSVVGAAGSVFVDGGLWAARNAGPEQIAPGDPVVVVARHGLRLDVRRRTGDAPPGGAPDA